MNTMSEIQQDDVNNEAAGILNIEVEEIQIPVPWGHVSGKWWGSKDTQPIVALHGWQDNAGTFDQLAPLISNGESLLCIDLPGHGFSSHLHDGAFYYVFWDGVLLLRRIVHYYKWQKMKLLGHSMGGAIAFLYAASYPDEVELMISLDIVTPSVRDVVKSAKITGVNIDKYLKYEKLTLEDVPSYEYEEMIGIVLDAYGGNISRESAEVLMKRGMRPALIPGKHLFTRDPRLKVSMLGLLSVDASKAYAKQIKCAYLNIRATQGLKLDIPGHYEEVLDIIKMTSKRFEYHQVDGTHHVHLNEPEKVAPIISAFLASP